MLQARVSKFNSSFVFEVVVAKQLLCKLHPGTTYETKAKLRYFDQSGSQTATMGGDPEGLFHLLLRSFLNHQPSICKQIAVGDELGLQEAAMFIKHTAARTGRID